MTRLRFFSQVNNNLNAGLYLFQNIKRKYFKYLSGLRLGTLPIRANTGRYERIDYNDRICVYCNMNTIEDEYHNCIICPKYSKLRRVFLPKWFLSCSRNGFIHAMQNQKKNLMLKLSLFLASSIQQRDSG